MIGSEIELKWNRKDAESLEHVLANHVSGRRAVVQAGGCLGVFAMRLAREFDAVYTFEPDSDLFNALCMNVPHINVIKFQAALGAAPRLVRTECSLRPNDGKTVLHEGMTRTEPGGIVPTLRIDDLGLETCDLIYLDVEGDELFALRGAAATIHRCRPVVVCEVNRGIEYRGLEQEDLRRHMRLLEYEKVAQLRSDEVYVSRGRK